MVLHQHTHIHTYIHTHTHTHAHIHTHTYITKLRQSLLEIARGVRAVCVFIQTISTHIIIHDESVAPVYVCVCVCVCVCM